MKRLFFISLLLLAGCTAVPVKQKFPDVPEPLKQECPPLAEVPEGTTKLSEVLNVVIGNYALYHECQAKAKTWNEWYNTQKKIYEK